MPPEPYNIRELMSYLPGGSVLTAPNLSWEEYEEVLEQRAERRGLRISYCDGKLKVVNLTVAHEIYTCFIHNLVSALSLRLHLNVISCGAATMKSQAKAKGTEPDGWFYVQTANVIGIRMDIDFAVDPPPDVALEVDIHHDSLDKLPIYQAFGVSEIWRYDERTLTILHLQHDEYSQAETSLALPMLTAQILTEYLTQMREEGEFKAILAFDEWLQTLSQ